MKIQTIKSIQVLDSRGKPTVRTFVFLEDGSVHSSSVPSGASTGKYEAVELRDNDPKKYFGQGVEQAVKNVNEVLSKVVQGQDTVNIRKLDEEMIAADGTENKSKLGANAILSVSQALVKAAAHAENLPLWKFINSYYFAGHSPAFPQLMVNVINGGKHADWNFDIQEFMIITRATIPSQSTKVASEIYHGIAKQLKKSKLSILVGDEGGYSPALSSNESAFETIINGATEAGYENGKDYVLAIDAAASEFYQNGTYILKKDNREISGDEMIEYYMNVHKKYGVYSFEDVFDQDDWEHFAKFNKQRNGNYIVVGDDLTVTNPKLIKKGIETEAASAVIIKPNQIGSVLETVAAITLAKAADWKVAVANRSGETEDSFIADLVYGSGSDFIKTGSMARSDRMSKYNRLLEIEAGL